MKTSILAGLFVVLAIAPPTALGQHEERTLTKQEVEAVKVAILDEIYDYDFQEQYIDILPMSASKYPLTVYVNPKIQAGKAGQVIYKLPIGEVFRVFEFNAGTAILVGAPRDKFPPTGGSNLTLYLKDDDICGHKRDWTRETVLINPNPSKNEVQAAVVRERQRKGTSQHDEIAHSQKSK